MPFPSRLSRMHRARVAVEILLAPTPVSTKNATEGHFVAMTEYMPVQGAPVRELQSPYLAYVSITIMLLSYMQVESASCLKLGATLVANDRSNVLVCQQVPL